MRYIDLPDHLMLSTGKTLKSVIELVELLERHPSYTRNLLALLYGQDLEVWLRRINEESKAGQVKKIRLTMKRPNEALVELIKVLGKYVGGDGTALIKTIQNAQPGSVIMIDAGVYNLPKPLVLQKSLVLIGKGLEQTSFVCSGAGSVLNLKGDYNWQIRDITFEHQGLLGADVVVIEGGSLVMERCLCKGGVKSLKGYSGGNGLAFLGKSKGDIKKCKFQNNEYGILVSGQAEPELEGNLCLGNKGCGIVYLDNAGGTACQNECIGNDRHGIRVSGQAQPVLEGNRCLNNNSSGITFMGNAGGIARSSECFGSGMLGIGVRGKARPILEGNLCREKKIGITYYENAGGIARNNECIGNEIFGIYVGGQAQPVLEDNRCSENKSSGIAYMDYTGGTACNNTCMGNDKYGIHVGGQAQPSLENNCCQKNKFIDFYDIRGVRHVKRYETIFSLRKK